jgi:hypothetical protein
MDVNDIQPVVIDHSLPLGRPHDIIVIVWLEVLILFVNLELNDVCEIGNFNGLSKCRVVEYYTLLGKRMDLHKTVVPELAKHSETDADIGMLMKIDKHSF